MTQDEPIIAFDWFSHQFTLEQRAEFVARVGPYLTPLFQPGDRALDLGCGAGPIAFFLEEQGARVTGIDLSPSLIAMAREEAAKRGSQAEFIRANALTHDLGEEIYRLVVCFGNVILDFPHESFPRFRDRIHQALRPGGHLVLEYRDGLLRVASMSEPQEVIEEGTTGQILRRFKEYDPALGAYLAEYRHLATGEVFEGTGYVYTGPLIRLVLEPRFERTQSIRLGEMSFMDIYRRR
jgi:SAM-dependent methyltransferase